MTIEDCKAVMVELDRLNLELADGLNLLTNEGIISDEVIGLRDICNSDAKACIIFLKSQVAISGAEIIRPVK